MQRLHNLAMRIIPTEAIGHFMIYESLLAYEDEDFEDLDDFEYFEDEDFDDFECFEDEDFDDFEDFDLFLADSARGPCSSLSTPTPPLGVPKAAEASEASKATAAAKMKYTLKSFMLRFLSLSGHEKEQDGK
eukprot:scaffold2422_cov56-Attheya_sp.AAC.6